MKFSTFKQLYDEALEYKDVDMYVHERGWQSWWMTRYDDGSTVRIPNILNAIYFMANNGFPEIRQKFNLTRSGLSQLSQIPVRTLEDWDSGARSFRSYNKLYICYIIFSEFVEGGKGMVKYELYENTEEFIYKKRHEIKRGCTLDFENGFEPVLIDSFDTEEEALQELSKYESDIWEMTYNGTLYRVTEYYVQENEYDVDGEWIGGGDICEFSEFDENSKEKILDF